MAPKHILLIDDDPSITTILAARLDQVDGIVTHTLNNGEQALAVALDTAPDLIVCDIDLGDEEFCGGDIAYRLASNELTAKIPVVFLSSMITTEDMGGRTGKALMISKKSGIDQVVTAILAELHRSTL